MPKRTSTSSTHTKSGHPKIRHRQADGEFKAPPPAQTPASTGKKPLAPAEFDQDSGQGYNRNREDIQE
jgi:hypothetical protein